MVNQPINNKSYFLSSSQTIGLQTWNCFLINNDLAHFHQQVRSPTANPRFYVKQQKCLSRRTRVPPAATIPGVEKTESLLRRTRQAPWINRKTTRNGIDTKKSSSLTSKRLTKARRLTPHIRQSDGFRWTTGEHRNRPVAPLTR